MKKVDDLLAHFVHQPQFSRLRRKRCFEMLKSSMPPSLQKGVAFMYVKKGTLFVAFKHPAFKMEFHYKAHSIKSLLTTLPPLKEACAEYEIKEIRAFVTKYAPVESKKISTIPVYKERSTAEFVIRTKDPDLKAIFSSIRQIVARNRS